MPVYVLNPGGEIPLRTQPLRCTVTLQGGAVGARLRAQDSRGPIADALDYGRSDMLVFPSVTSETVLAVTPPEGSTSFPAGSSALLTIMGASQDADPDRVNVARVDVSGMSTAELARLRPSAQGVTISAEAQQETRALSLVGDAARVSAIRLSEAGVLRATAVRRIVAIADDSASFRTHIADGSFAAAIELLTGIADVIAPEQQIELLLPGRQPVGLGAPENAGTQAARIVSEIPRSSLFDPTATVSGLTQAASSTGATTYVCVFTDEFGRGAEKALSALTDAEIPAAVIVLTPTGLAEHLGATNVPRVISLDASPHLALREQVLTDHPGRDRVVRELLGASVASSATPERTN